MNEKAHRSVKRDMLTEERGRMLQLAERLSAILEGRANPEEVTAVRELVAGYLSFKGIVGSLTQLIEYDLPDVENRLDNFTKALEAAFSGPSDPYDLFEQDPGRVLERGRLWIITHLFVDSSLILYALGRYGAAIIELHGSLERQAVERLANLVVSPDKSEIGLKLIERRTLPELAAMLRECGSLDKSDVKFIEKLNKLRNDLAHRNAKVISNALLSGQKIPVLDIDDAISAAHYTPLAVGAIQIFMKLLEWDEESQ